MVTQANLHHAIIEGIIKKGYAPSVDVLAKTLKTSTEAIVNGLYDLQDYHGVVLHPGEAKVWVIHPFSLAPTNFYVTSSTGEWWGNCAWCSLGIAALLKDDVKIITTLGAEATQIEINIINGVIQEKGLHIHFPIPMKNAWDNVIYTCSTMLVFENVEQVEHWCCKHNIPQGDLQPVEKIWAFAQRWYGNHLNEDWSKWTIKEAKQIFRDYGLDHAIWDLGESQERF